MEENKFEGEFVRCSGCGKRSNSFMDEQDMLIGEYCLIIQGWQMCFDLNKEYEEYYCPECQ